MKRKNLLAFIGLILVMLVGCSSNSQVSNDLDVGYPSVAPSMDMGIEVGRNLVSEEKVMYDIPQDYYGDTQFVEAVEQKQIKRGSILVEVERLPEVYDRVKLLLTENSGYIHSLREYSTDRDSSMVMQLKIKAENFETVYEKLKDFGNIKEATISNEDVTREYIDTTARIETLKVQEESLLNIMGKADKVEDLLRVESELQRVRQQIESSQGNLNYLDSAINYSDLNLTLVKIKEPEKVSSEMGILEGFIFNIKDGLGYWGNTFINLINAVLWYFPVFIIIYIIIRLLRLDKKAITRLKNNKENK